MTKAGCVKLAFYMFALMLAVGVYLNFGLGWALMAGGAMGVTDALLLVDVDPKKDGTK